MLINFISNNIMIEIIFLNMKFSVIYTHSKKIGFTYYK